MAPGIELGGAALPVIAGPCAIEGEARAVEAARALAALRDRLGLQLIYKSSFDKANRSSIGSFRGGPSPPPAGTWRWSPAAGRRRMDEGLAILARVKRETGLPLTTDVHLPEQCAAVAEVVDVLQIPAFLCRQTDLIVAAANAAADRGRALTIKKGQFMAPEDMRQAVAKAHAGGCRRVAVIERGSSFGYHNLVVDMRSFAVLQRAGIPVIFDATHSLQLPGSEIAAGGERAHTGGRREFAEPLARAAVAAGADGVFMEVHPEPERALSDAATQLTPAAAERLLASLLALRRALAEAAPVEVAS
ncbi:MAG: 3-deoxy-8-phosphooctulonate synthase [Acidobacteria bacterium]|nr:MAG: 3-deoxy-8-phosphooctulonate synthase [Acidobacteriota bacterium]